MEQQSHEQNYLIKPRIAGLFLMPLRWICAWVLFAAAWRRLVLKPESLDPNSPFYEGLKLNHFLPDAVLTGGALKYVLISPHLMQGFLYAFTGLEFVLGIMLFIGLATRLMGVILFFLFINLMLTVGWLGTTCLDEWTVAAFGIGLSVCFFLAGSGPYSLDAYLYNRFPNFALHPLFSWVASPELMYRFKYAHAKILALILSLLTLFFVLATNQYFVGGVYGPFHNPAISPHLRLHASLDATGNLNLFLYRNQGPDTYGAFITDIALLDAHQQIISDFKHDYLAHLPANQIQNYYLEKIFANGHALVIPLGALAKIQLPAKPNVKTIRVTDVSGLTWQTPLINSVDFFHAETLVAENW